MRKLGVTQELLALVTGLAHYLKLLVRISLQAALRLERDTHDPDPLELFLEAVGDLDVAREAERVLDLKADIKVLAQSRSDLCSKCGLAIEEECAKRADEIWHRACLVCADCRRDLGRQFEEAIWSESGRRILCRSCDGRAPTTITTTTTTTTTIPGDFEQISKLQQYVYLLRVALARLLSRLRSGGILPHTSGRFSDST